MDSYISSELIAKLREEQRSLRKSIRALEDQIKRAGLTPLADQFFRFHSIYQSHERLVGALLEAVEPDNPLPHLHGLR
jgi:hypothetical protein